MTPGARVRAHVPHGLIGAMSLIGLCVDLRVRHQGLAGGWTVAFTFVLVAAAFAASEGVALHVELGKNTHSVSLAELTLTVALFFLPAELLTFARLLGGTAVLVLLRRQRPLKVLFNMAVWILDVAVATYVFQSLGGSLHNGTARMVVPALAAALTAALIDSVAVNVVIAAVSGEVGLLRALRFVQTCLLGAACCATAGLVCVAALAFSAWLLIPLVLVTALYLHGFSRFGALRTQHANVKVMHDFAAELARTRHGDAVLRTVLSTAPTLLRAQHGALYTCDAQAVVVRRCQLDANGRLVETVLPIAELPTLLRRALTADRPTIVREGTRDRDGAAFLSACDVSDALLAPIQGDQGVRGVLLLANRMGDVNDFTDEDGLLLQTLAAHAGTALSNSRLVQQLDHDSMHDSLTGLANRAMFAQRVARVLARQGEGTAVLLMDLDRFKEVNDTLGHHHGDLLLQEIARRLSLEVSAHDLLARLGGDEFAVLMTNVSAQDAVARGERLLEVLSQPMELQGVEMEITASIGVTHLGPSAPRETPIDGTVLLQRADVAMYAAKKHYTGLHLYRDELDGYSPRRLALASGLRSAIELGQLTVRYQPQSRLSDSTIVGAEALVRWEHPVYGEVFPDDFISIAEQTGQIRELTRFVLDQALSRCAGWNAAGITLAVSVNLSVRNLLEPDLLITVDELLRRHRVAARQLTLEITESHLMGDPARTAEVLRELAARGVRLSIDDFGTGYSSLAYLKQLPVTEVKIDKSFIRDLAEDSDDAAIVEAIIGLAHTMNLQVVAEGVETAATQQRLAELGCDLMQGYHLARPIHASNLDAWLSQHGVGTPRSRLRVLPVPRSTEDANGVALPG